MNDVRTSERTRRLEKWPSCIIMVIKKCETSKLIQNGNLIFCGVQRQSSRGKEAIMLIII